MKKQSDVFQLRGRGLGDRGVGRHGSPDTAPKVRCVGDFDREGEYAMDAGAHVIPQLTVSWRR